MAPTLTPVTRTLTHVYGLELRHDTGDSDSDGRNLVGLAVPYDVELDVSDFWDDYTEVFRKGAFAKTIVDRRRPLQLLVSHDRRGLPIGQATELAEADDGLHATFHLENTSFADDVLSLVKSGALSGLSIGFEPITHRVTPGPQRQPASARDLHERTEVKLHEVSICNFPAYEDAGVRRVCDAQGRHPSVAALAAERARLHELRTVAVDRFGRVERR
jgi:hypothetical protein